MKSRFLIFSVAALLKFTTAVSFAQIQASKEPDELNRLRRDYLQKRAETLRPITTRYQTDLETLLRKLTQNGDLNGALAVQRELETARDNFVREETGELRKSLLATKWSWANNASEKGVAMTFSDDGTVSHIGMHGTWQFTGPHEVTITYSDGGKIVLRFDATLSSYYQVSGQIRGRRWQQ